jgi:hypothetical protein
MRSRTLIGLAAHLGAAGVAGTAAAWVLGHYAEASVALQLVALGVAAILCALPSALRVDDPVAFALRRLAARSQGARKNRLLRAVVLRRRMLERDDLPARTRRGLDRAFWSLARMARAALRAPRSTATVLDERIAAHVRILSRAQSAAGAAGALAAGLDTTAALSEVRLEGERLEAEVAALAEVSEEAERAS